MKTRLIAFLLFAICFTAQAKGPQQIRIYSSLGYSSSKGTAFRFNDGLNFGGLCAQVDLIYFIPDKMDKVTCGLTYNGAFLLGPDYTGEDFADGPFVFEFFGVKGGYRLFDNIITPFVNLATGVTRLRANEVILDEGETVEGINSYVFGLAPEIGVDISFLTIKATYIVPMPNKTWNGKKATAGSYSVSLGIHIPIRF